MSYEIGLKLSPLARGDAALVPLGRQLCVVEGEFIETRFRPNRPAADMGEIENLIFGRFTRIFEEFLRRLGETGTLLQRNSINLRPTKETRTLTEEERSRGICLYKSSRLRRN